MVNNFFVLKAQAGACIFFGLVIHCISTACSTPQVDPAPPPPRETAALPASEEPSQEPSAPAPQPSAPPPLPSAPGERPALIEHGPRSEPRIALTFDADMTRGMRKQIQKGQMRDQYDQRIVELLRRESVPATFFVTGLWAESYPSLLRSLAADKLFEIENHSYEHAAFSGPCFGLRVLRSREQKINSIQLAADSIEKYAGVRTAFFRFPGGCHRSADLALVAAAGHRAVQWDVVSGDVMYRDANKIVADVMQTVKPGSIIVMHFNGAPNTPATADALTRLLPDLHRRGFQFVRLRDLLPKSGL